MPESLRRRACMIIVLGLLLTGYGGMVVAALMASPLLFALAVILATALDVIVESRFPALTALLRQAQFAISHRAVLQTCLLVLLVAVGDADETISRLQLLVIAALVLGVPGARIGYLALLALARRRILPPLEVRNIELPDVFSTPSLPKVLSDKAALRLLVLGVLPVLAGAASVGMGDFRPLYVVVAVYWGIVAAAGTWLVARLLRLRGRPGPQDYLRAVVQALGRHRPEVVLYYSGPASAVYQVDMWLSTLESMRRRSVVLLRERPAFRSLQRTDVPVLCVPRSVDVMNLELPDVRVALYVANVGNNIHFLREPRVKHVFIGHGDSDKVGSFNPFSKVYDQIWVAGPAGRERYARARVGIRDEAIVEVGRPQVDVLRRATRSGPPTPARPLTVLYLPTWEGWTDDDFQTSLTGMGEALVRRLLASPLPVRVIYRPHPMTGLRDPRARAADTRIRALVDAASASAGPVLREAAGRLASLAERLATADLTAADERVLRAEWNEAFWTAHQGRHQVVGGRLPGLFDCFDAADLLIADVSGVVSDFVATGKPYAVANPKELSADQFRASFPSASAAYLLHPGCREIEDILAAATGGDDPLAGARVEARRYLLGPDRPSALARWDDAVDNLVESASKEWYGQYRTGPGIADLEHETAPMPG